jgi:flagellar FliJ protein
MSRHTKLQPIANIRKQQERNAGRLHGDTVRHAKQQQQQLKELISYRNQYEKAFQEASASGLSSIRMQEYKIFMNRLDEAINQQKQHVNNGRQQCETSQKEWMSRRSKSKVIDTVITNRQHEERKRIEKREQKELEDHPYKSKSLNVDNGV